MIVLPAAAVTPHQTDAAGESYKGPADALTTSRISQSDSLEPGLAVIPEWGKPYQEAYTSEKYGEQARQYPGYWYSSTAHDYPSFCAVLAGCVVVGA